MSNEGKYVILCRRGLTFGYLYPTKEGVNWVTTDIEKAYHYDSQEAADIMVENVKKEAQSSLLFERAVLELRIVKIIKEEKAK